MSKVYNIEGNIDFFAELYKSLDTDDNTNEENLCLITNDPLTNHFVKLECGHSFNYLPIYNDIKNHKQKFNSLEANGGRLKNNEIRCPYCRTKQTGLLPYHEELGLLKVHGVNYFDENIKITPDYYNYSYNCCQYLTQNPNFDPSGNNPVETSNGNQGNCKFLKCFLNGYHQCSQIIQGYSGEDLKVCTSHKNKILKKHNKEIKEKEKEEAKKVKNEAKLKEKEAKLKEKEAKLKEKESKLKENTKKTKKPVENVILSSNIIIENQENTQCIQIIKSGPNKGKVCGCKIYEKSYCKRHIKKTDIETENVIEQI